MKNQLQEDLLFLYDQLDDTENNSDAYERLSEALDDLPVKFAWPKICPTCSLSHTEEAWRALPFYGIDDLVEDDHGEHGMILELRNCPCGSTLAVPLARRGREVDLAARVFAEHRAMRDALGEVQRRCTELKEENRMLRKRLDSGTAS